MILMEIKINAPKDTNVLEKILGKYRTRQLILIMTDAICVFFSFITSAWLVHKMNFLSKDNKLIGIILIYILMNIVFLTVFKCRGRRININCFRMYINCITCVFNIYVFRV